MAVKTLQKCVSIIFRYFRTTQNNVIFSNIYNEIYCVVYYKYQKKKYHFLVLGNYLRIFTHSITRRPVDNGSVCSISSVSNDLVEINAVGLREAKRLRGKNQKKKKKKSTKLLFECHCKPIIKSSKPKDSSVLMPPAVRCAVLISL